MIFDDHTCKMFLFFRDLMRMFFWGLLFCMGLCPQLFFCSSKKRPTIILPIELPTSPSCSGSSVLTDSSKVESFAVSPSAEVDTLKDEILHLIITPESAYKLGSELHEMRNNQPGVMVSDVLEFFHNQVAIPLRKFFVDEQGNVKEREYNKFLEKCLPRLTLDKQMTPPISPSRLSPTKLRSSIFDDAS